MPLKIFGGSLLLPLRIDGYTFDRLDYVKSIDERISTQLKDQLPDFILSNYDTFVQFIEAYYEWMEQEGNPRYEGVSVGTYKDIDETLDRFLEYFRNIYLKDFPFDLADGINEKTLIKNITDLYRSKGSKASFDLLFRILYNTTVSVSYPRDRILRLSTSTFDDNQFLRIEPIFSVDEAITTINGLAVQRHPVTNEIKGTAKIDYVEYFQQGGIDFFRLSVVDVSGSFDDTNELEITTASETPITYRAKLFPTLSALNIVNGGSGFEINDEIIVSDSEKRLILRATVKQIGPAGEIRSFSYRDNYNVYREADELQYTLVTFAGTGAEFSPKAGNVLANKPDTYLDQTGKLSSRSFIQDNFYYQDFSYILRVDQALAKYAAIVRRLIHPSGFILLGEYLNENTISSGSTLTTSTLIRYNPTIGHYLPHTFGTTIDPRGFTYGGNHYDFYPLGYNGQDGRTAADFLDLSFASSTFGTPHLYPQNGQTHDPYIVYSNKAGSTLTFDAIETTRTLVNGAMGSTGYLGATTDSDGEFVGLFGFFPVGSNRTNTILSGYNGITHYGGYVSPKYTSLSGGYFGGQVVQVEGTDSATADYWIVNRHPAHLGVSGMGLTGERQRIRIPMLPTTLSSNVVYVQEEIVKQERPGESTAIGEVIEFIPSSYDHNSVLGGNPNDFENNATKRYNVGIDILVVDVLNGVFTSSFSSGINYFVSPADEHFVVSGGIETVIIDSRASNVPGTYDGMIFEIIDGTGAGQRATILGHDVDTLTGDIRLNFVFGEFMEIPPDATSQYVIYEEGIPNNDVYPIVGQKSQTSRLADTTFFQPSTDSSAAVFGNTYDRSWMDIPIETFIYDIDYT